MTDLSGIGSNKTFKTGLAPGAPYYYISAHLDLSGVVVPQGGITYYFNKDNNLGYMLTPLTAGIGYEQYHKFHMIDENAVIGEIVLYSNPDLVEGSVAPGNTLFFRVGGAETTTDDVKSDDVWGGPTGFVPSAVSVQDINTGSVCYFGHEGGGVDEDKKFLAVTIYEGLLPVAVGDDEPVPVGDDEPVFVPEPVVEDEPVIVETSRSQRAIKRSAKARAVVPPSISSGILNVVVKVYPKYQ
jgi:hypothetical protein